MQENKKKEESKLSNQKKNVKLLLVLYQA